MRHASRSAKPNEDRAGELELRVPIVMWREPFGELSLAHLEQSHGPEPE